MRWDIQKHTRDFRGACDKAMNQGRALKSLGDSDDPLMGMGLISSFRAERRSLADPEQGGAGAKRRRCVSERVRAKFALPRAASFRVSAALRPE